MCPDYAAQHYKHGAALRGSTSEIEMPTTLKAHYGGEVSRKLLDIDQTQEICDTAKIWKHVNALLKPLRAGL